MLTASCLHVLSAVGVPGGLQQSLRQQRPTSWCHLGSPATALSEDVMSLNPRFLESWAPTLHVALRLRWTSAEGAGSGRHDAPLVEHRIAREGIGK